MHDAPREPVTPRHVVSLQQSAAIDALTDSESRTDPPPPIPGGFYRSLRILMGWDSRAALRAEQDADGRQAPLLRVDQDGNARWSGCRCGGRVAQLRLGVVHRRWQRELH